MSPRKIDPLPQEKIASEKDYLKMKLRLAKLKAKAQVYREDNKMEFFTALPHQQKVLNYLYLDGKTIILIQGANRIGKTLFGAVFVGSCCLGEQPWDHQPTLFGNIPIRCRIICTDWDNHAAEVIVPKLKEWLPVGSYTTSKNNLGVESEFKFKNGSSINLLTHGQDTKMHEGWSGHIVWADEPLPKDKYVANKRGLVDYHGIFLMTMTALYEPWIMDDIALKNDPAIGTVLNLPMAANSYLSKADIDEYERNIPEDQRDARIHGGWLQLHGQIWSTFDMNQNVVDPFDIPADWPVFAMVDFHLSEKQMVNFIAVDEYNRHWGCDEIWEHLSPQEIGDAIVKYKIKHSCRLQHAFIDPLSKGDTAYIKNRGIEIEDAYTIIENKLSPYGIELHVASKDKVSGIRNVYDSFKGVNDRPTLYLFRNCNHTIWEVPRWVYDKDTGKPKDENDHACENLYRSTLTGIKYTKPSLETERINYPNRGKGIV